MDKYWIIVSKLRGLQSSLPFLLTFLMHCVTYINCKQQQHHLTWSAMHISSCSSKAFPSTKRIRLSINACMYQQSSVHARLYAVAGMASIHCNRLNWSRFHYTVYDTQSNYIGFFITYFERSYITVANMASSYTRIVYTHHTHTHNNVILLILNKHSSSFARQCRINIATLWTTHMKIVFALAIRCICCYSCPLKTHKFIQWHSLHHRHNSCSSFSSKW